MILVHLLVMLHSADTSFSTMIRPHKPEQVLKTLKNTNAKSCDVYHSIRHLFKTSFTALRRLRSIKNGSIEKRLKAKTLIESIAAHKQASQNTL